MRNIKGILAYDGTRYNGWQRQKMNGNTIQEKIEHMFTKLLGEATEIHAAGRTDAGVHARGQVFHFHTGCRMEVEQMLQSANEYLPKDIVILDLKEASERFHSRLNARGKWYRYCINDTGIRDVFHQKYEWELSGQPDVGQMRKAAEYLCGTHDFLGFSSLKKAKKSTVRTIERIDIYKKDGKLYLDFYGNGFLYNMVRILTGTLVEVGLGQRQPEEMPEILQAGDRKLAGAKAPAQGLTLMQVEY